MAISQEENKSKGLVLSSQVLVADMYIFQPWPGASMQSALTTQYTVMGLIPEHPHTINTPPEYTTPRSALVKQRERAPLSLPFCTPSC